MVVNCISEESRAGLIVIFLQLNNMIISVLECWSLESLLLYLVVVFKAIMHVGQELKIKPFKK